MPFLHVIDYVVTQERIVAIATSSSRFYRANGVNQLSNTDFHFNIYIPWTELLRKS